MTKLFVGILRVYQQVISPYLLSSCRYMPTCSEYAQHSIEKHGLLRGSLHAMRRLSRCNPLGGRGYDPVL